MSNKQIISDSQRGFDKKFKIRNNYNPPESIIVNSKSNLKTRTTSNMSFCPECNAMMHLDNGIFRCNICGYFSENKIKSKNICPEKTFLELNIDKENYKKGAIVKIYGHLTLKDDDILTNAKINVYSSQKYLTSTYTNNKGYFETNIVVNTIGRNPIKVCFKGDSEYETSSDIKYIEVYDSNQNIQKNRSTNEIISDLERLGELYKNGILTKDEFIKLKKRLI